MNGRTSSDGTSIWYSLCIHSGYTIHVAIGFCHRVSQTLATPGCNVMVLLHYSLRRLVGHDSPSKMFLQPAEPAAPARSYKQDFLSRGIPRFYALDLEPKRGLGNVSGPVIYHKCFL